MGERRHRLIIVGDVGVDLVLGPISGWPRIGTETLVERSELRAGGSAANAALAVSYLGGRSQLLSVVGNDEPGVWLASELGPSGVRPRTPATNEWYFWFSCETATMSAISSTGA